MRTILHHVMIIDDHYIVICFGADLNWMDGNYRNYECGVCVCVVRMMMGVLHVVCVSLDVLSLCVLSLI